jgi:hypothetical protein
MRPVQDKLVIEYLEAVCRYHKLDPYFLRNPSPKDYGDGNKFLLLWHYLRFPETSLLREKPKGLLGKVQEFMAKLTTWREWKREFSHFGALTEGISNERVIYIPTGAYLFMKKMRCVTQHLLQAPPIDLHVSLYQ